MLTPAGGYSPEGLSGKGRRRGRHLLGECESVSFAMKFSPASDTESPVVFLLDMDELVSYTRPSLSFPSFHSLILLFPEH